jgi:hypothetical protein
MSLELEESGEDIVVESFGGSGDLFVIKSHGIVIKMEDDNTIAVGSVIQYSPDKYVPYMKNSIKSIALNMNLEIDPNIDIISDSKFDSIDCVTEKHKQHKISKRENKTKVKNIIEKSIILKPGFYYFKIEKGWGIIYGVGHFKDMIYVLGIAKNKDDIGTRILDERTIEYIKQHSYIIFGEEAIISTTIVDVLKEVVDDPLKHLIMEAKRAKYGTNEIDFENVYPGAKLLFSYNFDNQQVYRTKTLYSAKDKDGKEFMIQYDFTRYGTGDDISEKISEIYNFEREITHGDYSCDDEYIEHDNYFDLTPVDFFLNHTSINYDFNPAEYIENFGYNTGSEEPRGLSAKNVTQIFLGTGNKSKLMDYLMHMYE